MGNSGISRGRFHWLAAALLVFSEFYYLLRATGDLLPLSAFFRIPWTALTAEFLNRGLWTLLLWLVWRSIRGQAHAKGRRLVLFSGGAAFALVLFTASSLVLIAFGSKIRIELTAWIRALELFLLLIWSLALLFLLASPYSRELWKRRRLYGAAVIGAFAYFVMKGLVWLELVAGPLRLPFDRFRPLWLVLPLLAFLGRLALMALMIEAAGPSADSAASQEAVVQQQGDDGQHADAGEQKP